MNVDDSMTSKLKDDFIDYKNRTSNDDTKSDRLFDDLFFYGTHKFSDFVDNKETGELYNLLKSSERHKNLYKLRKDFTHPKSHESLERSFNKLDLSIEKAQNRLLTSYREDYNDKLEDISSHLTKSAQAVTISLLLLGVSAGSFYLSGNTKETRQHEKYSDIQQDIEKVERSIEAKAKEGERWGIENPKNKPYFQRFKQSKENDKDSILAQHNLKDLNGLESKLDSLEQEKKESGLVASIIGIVTGLGSLPPGYAAFSNRYNAKRRREEIDYLDDKIAELKNQR